jgi:hypothetical protein
LILQENDFFLNVIALKTKKTGIIYLIYYMRSGANVVRN